MSMLEKLTEGIRQRSLANEGEMITQKWEKTGLLEGLNNDNARSNMARLLENQAAQLLKEESTMGAGMDVEGFAAVAFPIVRRVFGGLLAQDLVSVQPMSLPSGLIFFMDFTYKVQTGALGGAIADESVYGGGRVAGQITGGVDLTALPVGGLAGAHADANSDTGFRNLSSGYSHASASVDSITVTAHQEVVAFNSAGATNLKLMKYDADFSASNPYVLIVKTATSNLPDLDTDQLSAIVPDEAAATSLIGIGNAEQVDSKLQCVRRLTFISGSDLYLVFASAVSAEIGDGSLNASFDHVKFHYPVADSWKAGTGIGSVSGDSTAPAWPLESQGSMSEIDLKVDSVAVTAQTKKLKAHWSPELAQDLNAYHNLDAEVELTSVLSEMIALEIDNEILQDLVNGAAAETYQWSRRSGNHVGRTTGTGITADFTGTQSEWYETLLEVVNDISAIIHRKTLRGGANFLVCGPDVASILEFTSGFRASVELDGDKGSWGAVKAGSISNKMDIFVDPNFLRNVVLVGRRGSSFLESGYVYAPYVPLQMTPTVLGVDDFTPRKGVMTRYAKKMVRPDMYGLVIVRDLLG